MSMMCSFRHSGASASACYLRNLLESGAGASACRSCARPLPLSWISHKPGSHRIPFNVANSPVQLIIATNPMVERLVLPKGMSGATQNFVGFIRCRTLQPAKDFGQRSRWLPKYMDVIRHNYPRLKFVKEPFLFPAPERIPHHFRHTWIFKPKWSGSRLVGLPVIHNECLSRWFGRWHHLSLMGSRKRTGQAPCYEQRSSCNRFWLPVRQPSTIEHRIPAGESACPTKVSCYRQPKVSSTCHTPSC